MSLEICAPWNWKQKVIVPHPSHSLRWIAGCKAMQEGYEWTLDNFSKRCRFFSKDLQYTCGSQKEARQMSLEERNAYKVLSNQSKFFHHILRHLSWAVFQVMCFPYIYCFKIRTAADWGIVGNAGIWTAELAILGMSWRAKVETRAWKCFLLSTVSKKAYPAQFLDLEISNMSANFKIISAIFHPGPRAMFGVTLFLCIFIT